MFQKIVLALFLLVSAAVIAILGIASTRSGAYHVERSASTRATPPAVYGIVNDLRRFHEWSPWQKLDPALRSSVTGSGVGIGSSYSWVGNNDVGEGRMSITESNPVDLVGMKLEFIKPFASVCDVRFLIQPEGDGSRVTWAIDGTNSFMGKVMSLFVSMDAVLGKDFAEGLANLTRVSEASAAMPTSAPADSTAGEATAGSRR